jgi:aminopeptidase
MYQPSNEILKKYADILVKFALRSGEGAKKGDVIFVQLPECAKPFYLPLQQAILEAGAYPFFEYLPDGVAKSYYEQANDDQLSFYPDIYMSGKVNQMTHIISIIAEYDKYELKDIDPKKLARRVESRKPYVQQRVQKELEGKMTRTIGLYGTPAMAEDVGMSLEEYWEQIIQACYLDQENPVQHWEKTQSEIEHFISALNTLKIQKVHIEGVDANLWLTIGSDKKRLGGGGRNIPSFEIFTSPDWRGTQGRIRFNQPLYRYGQKIAGIRLTFEQGKVVDFDAKEGKELLKEILQIPGADALGEFSLTDARHSRITKFMGETLYDENVGGQYGNTHVAIGRSFEDATFNDISKLSEAERQEI